MVNLDHIQSFALKKTIVSGSERRQIFKLFNFVSENAFIFSSQIVEFLIDIIFYFYLYVAGKVRNGKLGIPWRFSVFHIFGKMNSRSTSPASFMDMPHF